MDNNIKLFRYSVFWSCALALAILPACSYCCDFKFLIADLFRIFVSPSNLVTDYFAIGGLGASLLNAALCGFSCNVLIKVVKAKMTSTTLAAYFLVIAHCFYGLNFLNMWPPFIGVFIYCLVTKKPFCQNITTAMFSTSLGPFISDFLFRYTVDSYVPHVPSASIHGIMLALLFGLFAGFIIPALIPETAKMHKGYNLYKAGLAIGLFGMFAFAFFYKTLGIDAPSALYRSNPVYEAHELSYILFMNLFFSFIFLVTLVFGFVQNKCSFNGYKHLLDCDGWKDDFIEKFGFPLTMINIGVYGLFIIAYINIAVSLTSGSGFTGPTCGVIIAAITFSACGQTPRNVFPVVLGFVILSIVVSIICFLSGRFTTWTLSTQTYINGLAFATGLCPFSGRYGRKYGVIAGILDAIICSSTAAMHGGFVLYNGGFSAGLTAMILISVLEFYCVKPIHDDNI